MQLGNITNESHSTRSAGARRSVRSQAGVGAYMGTVYAWMASGLAMSAGVAYWLSTQPDLLQEVFGGGAGIGLLLIPFILIFVLSARIPKASLIECGMWFLLMTGVMGTWFTGIAVQASQSAEYATAVFETLGVTVAMFAGMSLTGWITRKDLTAMGNFFLAALWGLIAVSFLNIFVFQSESVSLVYHVIGVVLFAGLTAYDTQKIKEHYYEHGHHHGLAIAGALSLYLDFVNMFLYLLQFFGASSDD